MTELTIWTWNVRYFSQGWSGLSTSWATMRAVADRIASHPSPPDVLALQEVETRSMRGGLHRATQLDRFLGCLRAALVRHGRRSTVQGHHVPVHRYGPSALPLYTTGLGLVTTAPLEVRAHGTTDVTHVRLPFFASVKQRRVVDHVELHHPEAAAPVHLFHTHLSLPAFLEVGVWNVPEMMGNGSNQLQEIGNLLERADRYRAGHAVVLGDFNSAPGSRAHREMLEAGWHDVTPEAQRERKTAAFLDRRMHIDHVFASPSVRLAHVDTHEIDDPDFVGLSDHAPKVVTVALPDAPPASESGRVADPAD